MSDLISLLYDILVEKKPNEIMASVGKHKLETI